MSNTIDSRLIGKSIKLLRISKNLTQSELADDIGYSTRNIRRIETNGTSSIDVVNTFAEYFQVSALDILNGCLLFYIKKHILHVFFSFYFKIMLLWSQYFKYFVTSFINFTIFINDYMIINIFFINFILCGF